MFSGGHFLSLALAGDFHRGAIPLTGSSHMMHLAASQPPGTTLLGMTCDNGSAPYLLGSRRYPSGGTFTGMALTLLNTGTYEPDPESQPTFVVPFLRGYLQYVRSP